MSYYDELGGEAPLRAILHEFVERVTSDLMIGFFFAGIDETRLAQLEFEHAAAFLGGPVTYSGRDLKSAHKRHPIMGGQYARRREILRQIMLRHAVPEHIASAWLAHQDSLRGEVTRDSGSECRDTRARVESTNAADTSAADTQAGTKAES